MTLILSQITIPTESGIPLTASEWLCSAPLWQLAKLTPINYMDIARCTIRAHSTHQGMSGMSNKMSGRNARLQPTANSNLELRGYTRTKTTQKIDVHDMFDPSSKAAIGGVRLTTILRAIPWASETRRVRARWAGDSHAASAFQMKCSPLSLAFCLPGVCSDYPTWGSPLGLRNPRLSEVSGVPPRKETQGQMSKRGKRLKLLHPPENPSWSSIERTTGQNTSGRVPSPWPQHNGWIVTDYVGPEVPLNRSRLGHGRGSRKA
ncbi:hypothetical protein C8F04DRAFT_1193758 [Mycena alexandri]|uniref:Uncharacterized protein n=1 Tax=Mycena alexandri TaxID=1745969 RepID=A0AAD6SCN4_9AGAR|nr:hypothetical protein C8F04DRAFT_1193758 [Mycena alexandri]